MDISALPLLNDQVELTAARQVVESAEQRLATLEADLQTEKQNKAAAAAAADEARIDLATGDGVESDLDAAKADFETAAAKVKDLTAEIEEQRETVGRLKERLKAARENSIDAIVGDYATASETLQERKVQAMKALATALENINAFEEKRSQNGLRGDERLVALTDEIRVRGGKRVVSDQLRYEAGRLEETID